MEEEEEYRCGFVSLIGAPNMGKSTLLNAILGEDLCVATARPQTTRHAILGVLTTPTCQLCFTDTPGVIATPAYKLQEGMMEAVQGALRSADVLLVVTDPYATPIPSDALFARVRQSFQPTIVVINKIDLAKDTSSFPAAPATFKEGGDKQKEQGNEKFSVVEMVDMWRQLIPGAIAIIPVCASKGSEDAGVTALRTLLQGGPDVPAALRGLGRPIPGMFLPGVQFPSNDDARRLIPESPPLYDEDTLTDRTERFFASEIIRAALFRKLGKELPYCCDVRIEEFKEPKEGQKDPIIRIRATIYVERDSQKGIVVGKGGLMVKDLGSDARVQLKDFFQSKVHLTLNVSVDKNWRKDENKLKAYGYMKK